MPDARWRARALAIKILARYGPPTRTRAHLRVSLRTRTYCQGCRFIARSAHAGVRDEILRRHVAGGHVITRRFPSTWS